MNEVREIFIANCDRITMRFAPLTPFSMAIL